MPDARTGARARALRAAQVVTLGLSSVGLASVGLAGAAATAGCAVSHGPDEPGRDSGAAVDAADEVVDSGTDAGRIADAGCPPIDFSTPPPSRACCDAAGFWWDESRNVCVIAVPGPFVPPAMA